MSLRLICILIAAPCLVGAGYLLGQSNTSSPVFRPSEQTRFQAIVVGDSAFLLDAANGSTWALSAQRDGVQGWLPLRRFEEGVAAERWTSGLRADPPSTFVPRLAPPLQVALEKEGYARVKLKRRKSGYLAVAGRVNRKEFNLLIDTGAPVTHLDRKRTERLGARLRIGPCSRMPPLGFAGPWPSRPRPNPRRALSPTIHRGAVVATPNLE
jgi:hypothetical protein